MRFSAVLLVVGFALVVGCGGKTALDTTPKSVVLAYGAVGNQFVPYKMTSSVNFNLEGVVNSWLSDIVYSVKVDSISADGAIARRVNFDDFVMGEISSGRLIPDPNASKYKGEFLWLKLGPKGEIVEWRGLDGIHAYTPEERDLKHVLVQQMASLFQPLPRQEVTVGSAWQGVMEIPFKMRGGEFTQKVTTDYRVLGFGQRNGRNCAKVETKTKIEGKGEGTRGPQSKFWVDSEGQGEGAVWFDYDNGVVAEYDIRITATQELSYERAGKSDVTTESATIDSETKIKLAK